jgi:hypothetical protein
VPSTLPLRVTAPIQRPFAIQDLSDFCPITGRRLMQSFGLASTVAATAMHLLDRQSTSPSRRQRQPRPTTAAGRTLRRARRKGSSSGPAKLLKLPKLLSSSSVLVNRCLPAPRPPPTSTRHQAHRFAWSLLLVPCSGFNDLQHPQLAVALGVLSLLSRSVYVINFVLGFVVQLASIPTKLPSGAYVGAQLVLPKDGKFLHVFFYLHHLLGYFGRH